MLFRVRKPFVWDGKDYILGDVIDIPEGHPRIEAMVNASKHIIYDAGVSETSRANEPQPATAWGHEL